jgi:hypothetical protein
VFKGAGLEKAEIERLVGGPPRLALEDIIHHPRMAEARKAYLDSFLDIYGGDPFLVRLLIESGRFLVYHLAIVLEASADPARRETWLTVGRLKQALLPFGFASDRQIDHLIKRLCSVGFMELAPAPSDRRVRILKPTEKLRAHDRDWLAAHYAGLATLFPAHDYRRVMRRDPEFQTLHRRTALAFLPLGAELFSYSPDMMLFLNKAAGYPILAALLQAAMATPDAPHTAVSYEDVGTRFGVSRTHVRQLLVAAEEACLVKLHARGGRRVEILPRLWASHDRGIAAGMYLHDMIYLATLRAATQAAA